MFMPKKILVPTDFTADSDIALRESVEIAKQFSAHITLIHVDDKIQEVGGDFSLNRNEVEAVEKSDAALARQRMAEEIQKVMKTSDVRIEIAERHGKTHEEILAYSAANGIDLIVLEPHSRKGLMKSLTGGVADKLIHQAHCPVLVLH